MVITVAAEMLNILTRLTRRESSSGLTILKPHQNSGALLQSTMGNFKSIIGTSLLLTKDVRIFIRAIPRGMGSQEWQSVISQFNRSKEWQSSYNKAIMSINHQKNNNQWVDYFCIMPVNNYVCDCPRSVLCLQK